MTLPAMPRRLMAHGPQGRGRSLSPCPSQAGGIPSGLLPLERATFMSAWRQKRPRGIMLVVRGLAGTAAARRCKPHEDVRWTT